MLMPIAIIDETTGKIIKWVIMDTVTGIVNLDLQFPDMAQANLYAVKDESFKWHILSNEIGIG